jgi:hypothetical protein
MENMLTLKFDCPAFIPKSHCSMKSNPCGACCVKCDIVFECAQAFRCHMMTLKDANILDKMLVLSGKFKMKNTHVATKVKSERRKQLKRR